MAKTLYFANLDAECHRGDNTAKLNGTAAFWFPRLLSESRGSNTDGTLTATVNTVTGPTNGIEVGVGTLGIEWISLPLSTDFTISGTITLNLWAAESSLSANAAINAVIDKVNGATGAITQIAKTARTTEMPLTTPTAANFTVTPTSTVCNRGDRLRVRVFADDSSTMASGSSVSCYYGRSTAGVQGDSLVTFTETLTFETAAPSGSTYYLTDSATINAGSAIEKTASATRGGGAATAVTNTAAGATAPIQITDSGGGTAVEWYSGPLTAVTLGGRAKFNIWARESSAAANASLKTEIAVVAGDGSGAAIWGAINVEGILTNGLAGELGTSDAATIAWPSGDDTAITAGQRLRFRVYVDDCANGSLVAANTVAVTYNGASVGVSGDTYVTLPATVTEQVAAATKKPRIVSTNVPVMRAALR